MKGTIRLALTACFTVSLVGCATYGPAPVSDVDQRYSSSSRGEYRGSYYKVKEGDTLYFISYLTDKDVNDLVALNHLTPPYTIYPGQRIRLWHPAYRSPHYGQAAPAPEPPERQPKPVAQVVVNGLNNKTKSAASGVVSKAGSTVKAATATAAKAGSSVASSTTAPTKKSSVNAKSRHTSDIAKNNSDVVKKDAVRRIEPSKAKAYGKSVSKNNVNSEIKAKHSEKTQKVERWLWPTKGRVIGKFSTGDQGNKGIDIAGQRGQAVVATAAGSVVYSGNALRGYGNLIIIKHNDNYLSAYAHNDRLLVKEGQNVIAGQKIGTMGSTGSSSVRLHFEIRYQGKSVNPSHYLP